MDSARRYSGFCRSKHFLYLLPLAELFKRPLCYDFPHSQMKGAHIFNSWKSMITLFNFTKPAQQSCITWSCACVSSLWKCLSLCRIINLIWCRYMWNDIMVACGESHMCIQANVVSGLFTSHLFSLIFPSGFLTSDNVCEGYTWAENSL